MGNFFRVGTSVAWALGIVGSAYSADLPSAPAPTMPADASYSFDQLEIRGGPLVSFHAPEVGDINLNGELVLPKFVNVPGWQDILIPRLHVGGMGNVSDGTSYAYAGAVWTVNFDHVFAEVFGGGAVHNGPLESPDPGRQNEPSLGCRELFHVGGNVGYRFDQNWSVMITLDHISNGKGVLSDCRANGGLSLVGLRVGHSF